MNLSDTSGVDFENFISTEKRFSKFHLSVDKKLQDL